MIFQIKFHLIFPRKLKVDNKLTKSFDDIAIGGISIPIDQSALLLAGVSSVSMWMIPVVIAGIGIGVFVIKRRK